MLGLLSLWENWIFIFLERTKGGGRRKSLGVAFWSAFLEHKRLGCHKRNFVVSGEKKGKRERKKPDRFNFSSFLPLGGWTLEQKRSEWGLRFNAHSWRIDSGSIWTFGCNPPMSFSHRKNYLSLFCGLTVEISEHHLSVHFTVCNSKEMKDRESPAKTLGASMAERERREREGERERERE